MNNYGVAESMEGLEFKHVVAPLDDTMRNAFEEGLQVDRQPFIHFGQTSRRTPVGNHSWEDID